MTLVCFPIDATGGAPTFSAQQTRQSVAALLMNGSSRPLGASGGRRPGPGLEVSATSTTWTVLAGVCVVDAAFTTAQAPYLVASDATVTGSMTPADGTNPRIDIIYVRVSDDPIDSTGLRQADILYLAGTAAASPVQPATPARSLLLATISVPKSGTGSPSASSSGYVAVGAGGVKPVLTAAMRDATLTNPTAGMTVYRVDTGLLQCYSGSAWVDVTRPAPSWFGTPAVGSYDTTKPILRADGRISGTSDSQGLFTAHLTQAASCILKATAHPEVGAATDCFEIARYDLFSLTGGAGGTGNVVFQHRLISTGAAVASKAYLHSVEILWQA